jgi:hypothetical protein
MPGHRLHLPRPNGQLQAAQSNLVASAICAPIRDSRYLLLTQLCLGSQMYQGDQFKEAPDRTLELIANQPGLTALMHCAMIGDVTAARRLLQAGASVGLVNVYGRNALIMAAMSGEEGIVRLLLSVDAPIDAVDAWDRDGKTAQGHLFHVLALYSPPPILFTCDHISLRPMHSAISPHANRIPSCGSFVLGEIPRS